MEILSPFHGINLAKVFDQVVVDSITESVHSEAVTYQNLASTEIPKPMTVEDYLKSIYLSMEAIEDIIKDATIRLILNNGDGRPPRILLINRPLKFRDKLYTMSTTVVLNTTASPQGPSYKIHCSVFNEDNLRVYGVLVTSAWYRPVESRVPSIVFLQSDWCDGGFQQKVEFFSTTWNVVDTSPPLVIERIQQIVSQTNLPPEIVHPRRSAVAPMKAYINNNLYVGPDVKNLVEGMFVNKKGCPAHVQAALMMIMPNQTTAVRRIPKEELRLMVHSPASERSLSTAIALARSDARFLLEMVKKATTVKTDILDSATPKHFLIDQLNLVESAAAFVYSHSLIDESAFDGK